VHLEFLVDVQRHRSAQNELGPLLDLNFLKVIRAGREILRRTLFNLELAIVGKVFGSIAGA